MDQEYYGRIITLSKNTTSLLENKIVIVYIDNLLNLGKEYEDLSEKDQRLVHSIYVAYELYSFMRELLTTNGSITRIIKGYAWLWRNSTLLSKNNSKDSTDIRIYSISNRISNISLPATMLKDSSLHMSHFTYSISLLSYTLPHFLHSNTTF